MKPTISFPILWAIARLCPALMAIFGCSSRVAPHNPREIRWEGEETDYHGTTVVLPDDGAAGNGKR
jgi:hypothetical protein